MLIEDRQEICDNLCKSLQLTNKNWDLESLSIVSHEYGEAVEATLIYGTKKLIDVTGLTGMEMINEIIGAMQ